MEDITSAAVPGPARRLLAPAGVLAGVAVAFAYVGTVDPSELGHYPVCPLLQMTGLYCPGCGGLRSAHAFIHGDFAASFGLNALGFAGYLVFAAVMVVWFSRAARGRPFAIRLPASYAWALGALAVVYTVVRNLPFGSGLAP